MKEKYPLLSVIVPIYGVEQYLEECISSIIRQTYTSLEIILVDDGAKGREPFICDEYALRDNRVRVIHKKNEGLVAARKTGIETATSDYITFVDGDDYIDSKLYEKMMGWIIKEEPDLLCVGFTQKDSDAETECVQIMPNGIYKGSDVVFFQRNMNCYNNKYYDYGIFPSTWSKIYKKEKIMETAKSVPENIRMGEDAAFTFPYILGCEKIVVDNSICGYYYRTVNNSMSRTVDEGLFYGSSDLYNYLKTFYESTKDAQIIRQLEIYRIYLMDTALSNWMSTKKLQEIPKVCTKIKELVENTILFKEMPDDPDICIPEGLKRKLTLIRKSKWRTLQLEWAERLLSCYLRTTVKNILGRV